MTFVYFECANTRNNIVATRDHSSNGQTTTHQSEMVNVSKVTHENTDVFDVEATVDFFHAHHEND